jgi:hypothetical protein
VKRGEERESWRPGEATTEPARGEGDGEKRRQPSGGRWTGGAAAASVERGGGFGVALRGGIDR